MDKAQRLFEAELSMIAIIVLREYGGLIQEPNDSAKGRRFEAVVCRNRGIESVENSGFNVETAI